MADYEDIQAGHAQRKVLLLSQSLSGPFCRIPSPSSSKEAVVIHKAAIFYLFAAATLKGRTPSSHLHVLCGPLGTKKHPSPDFLGSQFIHIRMRSSFVFRNNVSSFSHWVSKTFCLFRANLATPGNTTRNNVSAIMFPSLARL